MIVGRGKASFDELRNYLSLKLHSAPEMLVSKNWQKKEINVKVKDESDFNLKTLFFLYTYDNNIIMAGSAECKQNELVVVP